MDRRCVVLCLGEALKMDGSATSSLKARVKLASHLAKGKGFFVLLVDFLTVNLSTLHFNHAVVHLKKPIKRT